MRATSARIRACTALLLAAAAGSLPAAERAMRQTHAEPPPQRHAASVALRPLPATAGGAEIAVLEVTLRLSAPSVPAGTPLVQLALVADNVDTVATVIDDLGARDASGPLSLRYRDVDLGVEQARDSESGGRTRQWIADRATRGPVVVRYRVPATATLAPRGAAPPLGFRNDAGGISAGGNIFLLSPPGERPYRIQVRWDLSSLPAGSRAFSSLGQGDVSAESPLTFPQLRMSYFMAGTLGSFPAAPRKRQFFAAWQGAPPFDATALMRWTGVLRGHFGKMFAADGNRPYAVFLRYNPVNAGGGTGLFNSFVATYGAGKGQDMDELKILLSHEMFHTFQPFITEPAGKASSWFAEGLAVYYEALIPLRHRMITAAAYLQDVNFAAARYYSSLMAQLPNRDVAEGFWKDTRIRTLAYDRGMLYFASVDEAVRKASNGKRTLDTLVVEMRRRERANGRLTNADWENVLRANIGPQAVAAFAAFMDGRIPLPSSNAFGPCFERSSAMVRRYELGFEPAVLMEPERVVRGLVAGSAAEQAGLRNGDAIVKPIPQDRLQGDQKQVLQLIVRRGGAVEEISYLPRGEQVEVYQWRLKDALAASTPCVQ